MADQGTSTSGSGKTAESTTTTSNNSTATLNKKIPTLDIALTGASTYPQWISSLEDYLFLLDVPRTEYRVWDVVTGSYKKPEEKDKREHLQWREANVVALLTIKKNCDEEVRARIGGFREAKAAYEELKKAYEGKSVTELGALMKSVTRMHFDDRKTSIQDHIAEYGRAWNSFVAITARLDLTNDKGFGTALQYIAITGVLLTAVNVECGNTSLVFARVAYTRVSNNQSIIIRE